MNSTFSHIPPLNGSTPHHLEVNPQHGHPPTFSGFAALEELSTDPQHINVLPHDLSQRYWQHLQQQQLRGGAPGPSRFPIDPPNMPHIHLVQQPAPTNSWLTDFEGRTVYVGRGKVEEVGSDGDPVHPKTPRSLKMLSPSATPPPAPQMRKKTLDQGGAGRVGGWGQSWTPLRCDPICCDEYGFPIATPIESGSSTPFDASLLQTMAASGILYPHEPNLQEANQRLSDHMLRSTGYVPASSPLPWQRGALSSQSGYGNPMSPSTPAGVRWLRREHPLRQSFTTSEFGSLLGEKPRLPNQPINPAAQTERLHDLLDSSRPPKTTRQTRDRDYDENNTRQTPWSEHPPPRVGPFDQQKMPSLHPPVPSNASTELPETARLPPVTPSGPQPVQFPIQAPDTGRGSFSTDFPLSSTPPPRHRQRPSGRATPWPASSRRRIDPPVPPYPHIPPPQDPPAPLDPPPSGPRNMNVEAELSAQVSWWVGVALTGVDNIRTFFMRVGHLYNVLPHTDGCHLVKTSISALASTLQRRNRFSQEHMWLCSEGWHKKYVERLGSTQRTLQKLREFAAEVNGHEPKLNTINKVLGKLEEYNTKFTNLASKFNSLFDRLRVRHLHNSLVKEHADAIAARRNPGSAQDVRAWAEGKVRRALLRRDFEAYRTGRRTSLIS